MKSCVSWIPAAHGEAQGGHAGELEAGAGRHHRAGSLGRRGQASVPGWLEGPEAVHPDRSTATIGDARSPAAVSPPPVTGWVCRHTAVRMDRPPVATHGTASVDEHI